MSVDRSMRNMFAALLLVAAVLVAMNRVVASAPLGDWWLPLGLLVIGLALLPNWTFSRGVPEAEAETEPPAEAEALPPGTHSYSVSTQPRLHTMTIRPDPDLENYAVTVTNEGTGDILPFMEDKVGQTEELPAAGTIPIEAELVEPEPMPVPVSPETPAPVLEPAPSQEVVPVSPETPAPTAPAEPTIESPETPAEVKVAPSSSADDLTKLSGVGPKSAAALKAAGIDSYQKLAASGADTIRAALASGSVRLVSGDLDAWTQQAAYAARGDWDGLKQFNAGHKETDGD